MMPPDEKESNPTGLEPPVKQGRWQPLFDYFGTIRRFSRNARLFLAYSLISALGTGIWMVVFNLYLLRLGFPIPFIGLFLMVEMLFHGLLAFPAGLIADKIGRRRAFFFSTCINLVARGALLFTQDEPALLVLAGIAGIGEAFHGVAGPPFIMENSEPEERPLLFSLNSVFLFVSRSVGSALPLVWAVTLGVPDLDIGQARWILVASLPLTLVGLAPLMLMTERRVQLVESFRDLLTLKNVVNFNTIAKLTVVGLVVGLAYGLATRFFNVFFDLGMEASDQQISAIFAGGALSGAGAILFSGLLVRKWGKVRSIAITQIVSVPFLILMVSVSGLPAVVTFFFLQSAFYGISMPIRNQLAMEFTVAKERGTTAGMTHMSFDLGGAFGAGLAGVLIGIGSGGAAEVIPVSKFVPAFIAAGLLVLVAAILYQVFFHRQEMQQQRPQVVTPAR